MGPHRKGSSEEAPGHRTLAPTETHFRFRPATGSGKHRKSPPGGHRSEGRREGELGSEGGRRPRRPAEGLDRTLTVVDALSSSGCRRNFTSNKPGHVQWGPNRVLRAGLTCRVSRFSRPSQEPSEFMRIIRMVVLI